MCNAEFLKLQIKNNLNIEQIIEHYLGFAGRNRRWKCPFNHDEEHLNFAINGKRTWRCFSCQDSGDDIKFVMKLFNLDTIQAMKKLCIDFNLPIEASEEEIKKSRQHQEKLRKKREKEKKRQENIHTYEIVILKRIYKKLEQLNSILERNKPYNINKLENYMSSDSCTRYIMALQKVEELNAMWDIICENNLQGDWEYLFPATTPKEKEDRKVDLLRKLYKGEVQI